MNATLRAPFPWFGGKSRAAHIIWPRFGDTVNYVEPFAGSLAVLLNRPYPVRTETVNDADCYLSNFWRALQHDLDAVAYYADWPVNECVPAGTLIATPDGYLPVEEIRVGMTVLGDKCGRVVETKVVATKSSKASEFYKVGSLELTGNHPVWTLEDGYKEASSLTGGVHVKTLDLGASETDLKVLYCSHEKHQKSSVGNLHIKRSERRKDPLCGGDIQGQKEVERTHVTGGSWRENPSGLLDTFVSKSKTKASVCGCAGWSGGGLARSRKILDRKVWRLGGVDKPHRGGRRNARVYPVGGVAPKVVKNAARGSLRPRSTLGHVGQKTYTRSSGKNSCRWYGAQAQQANKAKTLRNTQRKNFVKGASPQAIRGTSRQNVVGIPQKENSRHYDKSQASDLHRNGRDLSVNNSSSKGFRGGRGIGKSSDSQGLPLQRKSLPFSVAVYNFQTTTGNYFANRVLVHNCDLHARHRWLVNQHTFRERMMTEPDFFDAKIAGWWVWGLSAWIGSGWCSLAGVESAQRPHLGDHGRGVHRKRPHLAQQGDGGGRGVHRAQLQPANGRSRPNLRPAQGINRQLPQLSGNSGAVGSGIHAKYARTDLYAYMNALADRLRRTRVCCGDWSRVMGKSVTWKIGTTAVLLDPPYNSDAGRASDLYAVDCESVSTAVREWAIENGDNPKLRIALCGYEAEHAPYMPSGWECVAWDAGKGYGGQRKGNDNTNGKNERVWFSPHCLSQGVASGIVDTRDYSNLFSEVS